MENSDNLESGGNHSALDWTALQSRSRFKKEKLDSSHLNQSKIAKSIDPPIIVGTKHRIYSEWYQVNQKWLKNTDMKKWLLTPCKHSVSLQVPLETFSSQLHRQLPVFGFHCFGNCLNSELYRIHVLLLEPHTCVFSTQAISGTLTAALPSKLVRCGHECIIAYYLEVKDAANFLSIRESSL